MKADMNNSENFNTESNKDIIKKILSEKESDEQALEKMYKILNEASAADDLTMDTDLIDECIKTIEILEGRQDNIPPEKLRDMKQEIKSKYKNSEKGYKHIIRKKLVRVAACLILVFSMTIVADAFGFNPVKVIISWREDTFNLITGIKNDIQDNNTPKGSTFVQMKDVFENIKPSPLIPKWLPEGFSFKYAEKFVRSDNTNILLTYEYEEDGKIIIFDYVIYNDEGKNTENETSFEKDSNEVEVYYKNGISHHIFSNLNQVQAVWGRLNTIYNINSDTSKEEIKKIIDSMYCE